MIRVVLTALAVACGGRADVTAQELEPRLFSNAPIGTNYSVLAYSYSRGNIFLDPSTPIEDLTASLHASVLGYARVIDVFGMSGQLDAILPFASGNWEGAIDGVDSTRTVTGLGDPALRFSVRFLGSPATRAAEFGEYEQGTIVGGALQIRVPIGQYDRTKLINLGSNRWVFRPQLGVSHRTGDLVVESIVSAWLFTRNDEFRNGNSLSQMPIGAIQTHASYIFRPGLWVSGNVAYWSGGRTVINGDERDTRRSNWRFGGTLAVPVSGPHSIKIALLSGVASGAGSDYDTFVIAYQYRWGGRGPPSRSPGNGGDRIARLATRLR